MNDRQDALEQAQRAYQDGRWDDALTGYRAAQAETDLAPDDLHALSNAAWWLGRQDECLALSEEAFVAYREAGLGPEAALLALDLGFLWLLRGETTIGSGWIARARRLLMDEPESAAHGYVLSFEIEQALGEAKTDVALALATKIGEIARRCDDPTLEAIGLVGQGIAQIKQGQVEAGMAVLDEAMLPVLAGRVTPDWAGNIYCRIMAVCHELSDPERARSWTDATERWCNQYTSAVMFAGICRIHRAQLLQLEGNWHRAETEAIRACRELAEMNVEVVAEGHYQAGEVRRLRGELAEAEEAFREAHRLGRRPQPGMALLRLAQGRTADAEAAIRTAVAAENDPLARAPLLAAQVDIALTAHDVSTAGRAAADLGTIADKYATPGLEAAARQADGAVLAARDQPTEALPVLTDAVRRWQQLEAPYQTAQTRVLLADVCRRLGDADSARRERTAAEETFARLGAMTALRSLGSRGDLPMDLTEREVEVLALVARGDTNRRIAEHLFISEKTVARHLSNIFAKLGVSSRTAAAGFAHQHGLAEVDG